MEKIKIEASVLKILTDPTENYDVKVCESAETEWKPSDAEITYSNPMGRIIIFHNSRRIFFETFFVSGKMDMRAEILTSEEALDSLIDHAMKIRTPFSQKEKTIKSAKRNIDIFLKNVPDWIKQYHKRPNSTRT
jgi:hypothetical protein